MVFIRDNHRCVKCGSRKDLELHHIIPHAMGGSSRLENLQLLCQRCNRMKGVD
ncbi:MAG TPA: HNH endonuclease [Candidatus Latescibacteria bacterium]|nr:HNH endonuclease [Candidatus Latescibacterota bacterium]